MKVIAVCLLVSATVLALCAPAQAQGLAERSNIAIQFDNSARSVEGKNAQVIKALAEKVFLVPVAKVKFISCVAQSVLGGVLGSQSVCTYSAEGPTTNRRTTLQNCQENIRTGLGGVIGLDSVAENAIEKETDTLIPGDKIELEKATCAQG